MSNEPVAQLRCAEQVFHINFSPILETQTLAVGLIDGSIELWNTNIAVASGSSSSSNSSSTNGNPYTEAEGASLMAQFTPHSSSCRGVQFSADGRVLYSISSDRSLLATDLNAPLHSYSALFVCQDAHETAINRMHVVSEHLIATGDDSGVVKLWDTRLQSSKSNSSSNCAMQWQLHKDFISGFAQHEQQQHSLLSVSGDSTLACYDLRSSEVCFRSDEQEEELLCCAVMKGGRKVMCGTQDGTVVVFSWGRWGDCSDRFPGHPEAVDCLLKIDESTLLTGSSDGLIRAVQLLPNKILGVLGDHAEFPVEGIAMSADRRCIGSYAHDGTVRLWDASMFADDDEDGDVDGDIVDGEVGDEAAALAAAVDDDDEGDDDEGDAEGDGEWEDMDDDDEEDEEEEEEALMDEASSSSDTNSDSDSDNSGTAATGKGPLKLPTNSERFYADLL